MPSGAKKFARGNECCPIPVALNLAPVLGSSLLVQSYIWSSQMLRETAEYREHGSSLRSGSWETPVRYGPEVSRSIDFRSAEFTKYFTSYGGDRVELMTRLPWYQARTNRGKDVTVETASLGSAIAPPPHVPFPSSVRVISRDAFHTMISGRAAASRG